MTERELKAEIKEKKFRNFYFIYGEDSYLKGYYTKLIAEKCAAILPEMNQIKIDGGDKQFNVKTLSVQTEQLPCMADYRCVILDDYNFASAAESERKAFLELISDLPETTVLILFAETIEIDPNPKKQGNWAKLVKTAEKCGAVINFAHMEIPELKRTLISAAKKRKAELEISAAEYLINCCGRELSKLRSEIDKLCMYCGEGGRITKADIDKLCAKTVDANKYQLSGYIFALEVSKAMKMIADLLDMKLKPIDISALIIGGFVDAYRSKIIAQSGKSVNECAAALGYGGRAFALEKAQRQVRGYSIKTLRECLDILNESDIRLKSTSDDKRFVVEQTVLRVVGVLKND